MQPVSIEKNLRPDLISADFNINITKNTCPFTLELVNDCKVRNSIIDDDLCFFMLETCYFQKQGKIKKTV